jgi:sporulation protein YlmC with PRC-barrel domain
MISKNQLDHLHSRTVLDSEGNKVGSVGAVYLDDRTDEPDWMTVKSGLFGTTELFVPLSQASLEGGEIHLPFPKDKVKDAPKIAAVEHLDTAQERELYRYYGVDYDHGGPG